MTIIFTLLMIQCEMKGSSRSSSRSSRSSYSYSYSSSYYTYYSYNYGSYGYSSNGASGGWWWIIMVCLIGGFIIFLFIILLIARCLGIHICTSLLCIFCCKCGTYRDLDQKYRTTNVVVVPPCTDEIVVV